MPIPWPQARGRQWLGLGLAVVLTLLIGLVLVRSDISTRRESFQAEARTAHRLLSQRMAQNEAVLATLALNAIEDRSATSALPLPPAWRHLLAAQRSRVDPSVAPAGSASSYRVELIDAAAGRYQLVMLHQGFDHRLLVDAKRLLDDEAWPWRLDGPVQVRLMVQGTGVVLQPGVDEALRPAGLTEGFRFVQTLASETQPFELGVQRWTGPSEWPWAQLALAAVASALLVTLMFRAQAQRVERQRAAQLRRLAQVARLNTLGELAAGVAHELNQPLTAVLSGTQAALRLLQEAQTEGHVEAAAEAVPALRLAAAQARRAADVVARLRSLVKPPALGPVAQVVDLSALVQGLLDVLAPELRQQSISVELRGQAPAVRADRIALEQILHNLLTNAMQALEVSQPPNRRIQVSLHERAGWVDCTVADNGPGLPSDHLARIFEPFFTTRADGLGLGLSLCQTLAQAMGGQLTAGASEMRGASFCLSMPMAHSDSKTS